MAQPSRPCDSPEMHPDDNKLNSEALIFDASPRLLGVWYLNPFALNPHTNAGDKEAPESYRFWSNLGTDRDVKSAPLAGELDTVIRKNERRPLCQWRRCKFNLGTV